MYMTTIQVIDCARARACTAAGEGKSALLKFDGAGLEAKVESVTLSDPHLREDWGDTIYRFQLNSKQPVAKGSCSYKFTRA